MSAVKRWLKNIFYSTGNARTLDRIVYLKSSLRYMAGNRRYISTHPQHALPPLYFLYETYIPDYERYINDGRNAAEEIMGWAMPYLPGYSIHILEWGCGVGRIIRHIPAITPPGTRISACDINEQMILWNRKNLLGIEFSTSGHLPPIPYPADEFNFVYAISVLTHIDGREHLPWLKELQRIIKTGGILLFTTHGEYFLPQLSDNELIQFRKDGFFTRSYPDKGHRMMTTYSDAQALRSQISAYFDVLEFHDGKKDTSITGGQDLWILKKK